MRDALVAFLLALREEITSLPVFQVHEANAYHFSYIVIGIAVLAVPGKCAIE